MGLTKLSQVGYKVEGTQGTEETLAAGDYTGNRKSIAFEADINQYARDLVRGSLSPLPVLKGQRMGMVKWVEEMVGGTNAAEPAWHAAVRAMGFEVTQLKKLSIGSVTGGTFAVGQVVGNNATRSSATKLGRIARLPAGEVVVHQTSGTAFAAADTLYNYASPQVSGTLSGSAANAGWGLRPKSESDSYEPPTLTIDGRNTGERRTIVGARGSGSISLRLGEPPLLSCNFEGLNVLDGSSGGFRTGALVANVPAVGVIPRVAKGNPLTLTPAGGSPYQPILSEVPIDLGITLARRPSIGQNVASSGYMPPRITGRMLKASVDPEAVPPGTFNLPAQFFGDTTMELYIDVGAVGTAFGLTAFYAPAAQVSGNLSFGDRDGLETSPAELLFTGDEDDELFVWRMF